MRGMNLRLIGRSLLGAPRRSRPYHSLAGRLGLLAGLCRLLPACGDVDDVCSNESDCSYTTGSGGPECESLTLSECGTANHCSVESACHPRCSGPSCDDACDVVSRCVPN
jgi:hypothetical protein